MTSKLKHILEKHKELIALTEHLDGLSKDLSDRDVTAYLDQLLEVVVKTNELMEGLLPMRKIPRLRIVQSLAAGESENE